MKRTMMPWMILFLFSGCVVVERRRPPPPLALTQAGAVSQGMRYCRSRRLDCSVREAHLTANGIWRVHLRVYGPAERGQLHLDYDAVSGALLRVQERLVQRYGPEVDDPAKDPFGERAHGDD